MTGKKINALLFLGWHFFLHFFRRLLPQNHASKTFLAHYSFDHIQPVPLNIRENMPGYSTCISCRLCDTVCPDLASNPSLLSPSFLVMGFSRGLTDHHLFFEDLSGCQDCQACEDICPQNVPIGGIIRFMADHVKTTSV